MNIFGTQKIKSDALELSLVENNNDLNKVAASMRDYIDNMDSYEKLGLITEEQRVALASNIGEIGISVDYSINNLRNPIFDEFPLVNWLLSTPLANQVRSGIRESLSRLFKDNNGVWTFLLPWSVYTLPPEDTTGECCWVPFDIAKCGDTVPLALLCLKDCYEIFDYLVERDRYPGSSDLVGYFQRPGESTKAARDRMARFTFAWLSAWNIINGTMDATTGVLKPFHGLLEVMEDEAVIKIGAPDVIGGFAQLWCRLVVQDGGNYVIWAHPLTVMGIASKIQRGRLGDYPAGWTKDDAGNVSFNGIPIRGDKTIPVDLEAGTGTAYLLEGNSIAAYMATTLNPADRFVFDDNYVNNDDPDQGCANICTYYYNYGTVFTVNPNRLAVLTDIPLSTACLGSALQGLEDLVTPNTPVPK